MEYNLGKVLLTPKGNYNGSTAYEILDVVTYNGSSYVAKQSTTGNAPTDGQTNTYWQLLAYGIDGGATSSTDVMINGVSITNNDIANILTEGAYDGTSNKIATMSEIPQPEVFWATYGTTTAAEIDAAVAAGKVVMCKYDNKLFTLAHYKSSDLFVYFGGVYATNAIWLRILRSNNTWANGIDSLQLVSNKVSTIAGNETSTTKYPSTKAVADYAQTISNKVTSFQTTPDDTHYPSEKLVKDSLDTKIDNTDVEALTAIDVDNTPTANSSNLVTSGGVYGYVNPLLGKWGVISQTQTWSGTGSQPRTYVMSNLVYGTIPQANIDLFESAGATFNATSGYFEINGLTDISYEEMQKIYNNSIVASTMVSTRSMAFVNTSIRCTLPLRTITAFTTNFSYMCYDANAIEQVNIGNSYLSSTSTLTYAFNNAYCLKKIGNGYMDYIGGTNDSAFRNCYSLETVHLRKLKANMKFDWSPNLSMESIAYMVTNAGTDNITITLHPTAYDASIANADVTAALQTKTNVSLASA